MTTGGLRRSRPMPELPQDARDGAPPMPRAKQAARLRCGVCHLHQPTHDRDPGGACAVAGASGRGIDPAERDHRDPHPRRRGDGGKPEGGAVAGLARGGEDRAQRDVVRAALGRRLDVAERVGRDADESRADASPGRGDGRPVRPAAEMDAGAEVGREIGVAADGEHAARSADAFGDPRRQRPALGRRHVLVAEPDPAAAAVEDGTHGVDQGARPGPVRHRQQRRRQAHEPTRPSCGLDGSARPRRGMRPAR